MYTIEDMRRLKWVAVDKIAQHRTSCDHCKKLPTYFTDNLACDDMQLLLLGYSRASEIVRNG